ncbi:hypothetical protein ACC687_41150, partial [Rhizobium ruizarguesonis]
DRQAMLGTLFPEQAKIATQLVLPTTIGYNVDIPAWSYDPEKAKQLVEAAKADCVPVDREIRIIASIASVAFGYCPLRPMMR